MADELNKISPGLADNPLINPPQSVLDSAKTWPTLTDQQSQDFNNLYGAVTGA